jgi:hypothetical protein
MMLSYLQIQEAIENEGRRLGQLAEECAGIADAAAEAEADYKVATAQARMRIRDDAAARGVKLTVGEVDDMALSEAADAFRAYLRLSGSMTAIREALRAATGRLDGLRTLASGHKNAGG